MNKKIVLVLGAVVAVLLVVSIFFLAGSGGDQKEEEVIFDADPSEPRISEESGLPLVVDDPREVLEKYIKWAKYPPSTRPLHKGQVDLLEPYNAGHRHAAMPVLKEPCEKDAEGKCTTKGVLSEIRCQLLPESAISVGKTDFRVFLNCLQPGPEQKNIKLNIAEMKVYVEKMRRPVGTLPPVGSGDDGTNGDAVKGDGVYTFLLRPTGTDWGPMYFEVFFEVDGLKHNQRVSWYSTPHVIADFSGSTRDSLRNGHLNVSIPVNVKKPGFFVIQANLQEKEGDQRLVASATWQGELAGGAQVVDLEFFGKVIRDQNINGPYIVRNIRGQRDNSGVTPAVLRKALESGQEVPAQDHREPLFEYMVPGADHVTASYKAQDFSDKEWESADKERRINYLKSLQTQE